MSRKAEAKNSSDNERPSKSQLKREMLELQALGERLVGLPDAQLSKLPLPEALRDAVNDARKMTKRGALHRQKQFIGRVMRDIDAEPIRAALERIQAGSRVAAARFHSIENWRDRLIGEGDPALESLLEAQPAADRQHLRRLMRDAAAEKERGRPPKAARQLFRYLDRLMD